MSQPDKRDFTYRDCGEVIRVWRNDWPGDQFEIFTRDQFAQFTALAERLAIGVLEVED